MFILDCEKVKKNDIEIVRNMESMAAPIIIRPSSLPMYADCERRQAAKMFPVQIRDYGYSLGEREQSAGAAVGTATHSAVAHILRSKKHSLQGGYTGAKWDFSSRCCEFLAGRLRSLSLILGLCPGHARSPPGNRPG